MWAYDDIYQALIQYITTDLRESDYTLNFGVVAIATTSPRALIRLKLKNVLTNRQKRWSCLLVGETIKELENCIRSYITPYIGTF